MTDTPPNLSSDELKTLVQPVCDAVQSISDAVIVFGSFTRAEFEIPNDAEMKLAIDARGAVNSENRKQFMIRAHFVLSLANGQKETLISIEASYVIHYETAEGFEVTDEQAHLYARYNGVFNAWPHWREYVQNCCMRMNIPRIPLPVYREGMTELSSHLSAGDAPAPKVSQLPPSK